MVAITFFVISLLLTTSNCAQKIPQCQDEIWDIGYAKDAQEGEAQLHFSVPNITEKISSVNSILMCDDLKVNGTGKRALSMEKGHSMTVYQVSMPEANDFEEFETQGEWQSHTCVIQFTYLSSTTSATDTEAEELECELKLLTVLGRILPRCDLDRALSFLKSVEIEKKLGQVLLDFKNSGNDVFTHDSKCEVGSIDEHEHSVAMEENMIPLAPPGADSPIIDIDFYPDCDNETVMKEYLDHEMSECHMEVYQVCQEGQQLVKEIELEFNEGALICETPKPGYQVLLESLELTFFIESRPVVGLIFLLLCNGALYIILIPVVICKMVGGCGCGGSDKKTTQPEEKLSLLDHQQSPPESPAALHQSPKPPGVNPHTITQSPSVHPHTSTESHAVRCTSSHIN